MTLRELAKTLPDLCQQLAGFRQADAVTVTSGLILESRNHMFQPLLEALLLLIATHAKGNAKPTLKDVRSWLDAIAETAISHQVDVPEDVFAATVCWDDKRGTGSNCALCTGRVGALWT